MILNYLASKGRKSILVDGYARVRMERYDLLWREEEAEGKPWPNAWLHHMPGPESPDAKDDPHSHPWRTITFILKGGYLEVINRTIRRLVTRCAFLSYKSNHRIDTVLPGTWTLFLHGFRQRPWTFHFDECATLCKACSDRGTTCFKQVNPTMEFTELFGRGGDALQWMRWTPQLERELAVKRRALRMKKVTPTREEASQAYRQRIV
jgi:hypothetical protein